MKVYGLIGYPLGHSFSGKYFTEKFEREKIEDVEFKLFPIASIHEMPQLLVENKLLAGIAVTIPYKEKVVEYLSTISESAKAIGAVNCIKVEGNTLHGYNTDVMGFEQSLKPLLHKHHQNALILGSGGGSKAVQFALKKLGISFKVVSRIATESDNSITYQAVDKSLITNHTVIINTTPLGTAPNVDDCAPLPYQYLTSAHLLYDLVYNPTETLFLQHGKKNGAVIKNGYQMLVLQAEENWKIWTNPLI